MRRFIFMVLSIAVLTIGGATAATSATAGTASTHVVATRQILCPTASSCCGPPVDSSSVRLRAGSATQTPCCQDGQTACCPADQTTCCPTGTSCCTGCSAQLTIAATPNPSQAGKRVTISGHLSSEPAGTDVELWQRLPGHSFASIKQATTNSSDDYSFVLGPGVVMTNRDWYVSAGSAVSSTIAEGVHALVTLSAASGSLAAGAPLRLSGHVTPSHAHDTVLIERRIAGHWRIITRPRTGRGSRYALTRRFTSRGRISLRAVLPASARNLRSSSSTVVIRVS